MKSEKELKEIAKRDANRFCKEIVFMKNTIVVLLI